MIKYKDIELPCSFFVVARYSPELLGMLDCEKLEFLSVNCTMLDVSCKNRTDQ